MRIKISILAPSYDILWYLYQFSDFILKSPKANVKNGLWLIQELILDYLQTDQMYQ